MNAPGHTLLKHVDHDLHRCLQASKDTHVYSSFFTDAPFFIYVHPKSFFSFKLQMYRSGENDGTKLQSLSIAPAQRKPKTYIWWHVCLHPAGMSCCTPMVQGLI